jgi:hypothetical protein
MTLWIVSIKDPYLLLNYELILGKLKDSEKAAVTRFVFPEDRYRALLSILLQHALINETFGFTRNEQYSILRTSEVDIYISEEFLSCPIFIFPCFLRVSPIFLFPA